MMDPYRILFPLGALAAILGSVFWIRFGFGVAGAYPGGYHPDLMIGGFIFAFAAGFLMTAVPQFTGGRHASGREFAVMTTLVLACLILGLLPARLPFHITSALALANLTGFCGRRFLARTYDPPRFFVFVGLGLATGILGAILLAAADSGVVEGGWASLGKLLYTQGMALSLIVGVGTNLLPAIFGWSDLPIQLTRLDAPTRHALLTVGPVAILAAALVASFAIDATGHAGIGRAIRAIIVSCLALTRWKLLRWPRARGKLAFWLWVSAWLLTVGLWLPVLFPPLWIHGIHVAFIGGFGLMTFMIASRVALAHGGHGVRLELRSLALTASALLIILAAVLRFAAGFSPGAYAHGLGFAAIAWCLAVLLWAAVFLPRIIRVKD